MCGPEAVFLTCGRAAPLVLMHNTIRKDSENRPYTKGHLLKTVSRCPPCPYVLTDGYMRLISS